MNSQNYLFWILDQTHDFYTIKAVDEDSLIIDSELVRGEIHVYHFEQDIIELALIRKSDDDNVFFLHFELKDEKHAREMFREMIDALMDENSRKTVRVLLSCTSGLTTSFFAEKLNEAAKTLSLDYRFQAVHFNDIYQYADQFDIILLAPQIAYAFDKIQESFHHHVVKVIPGKIFASYNTGKLITLIQREIKKKNEARKNHEIAIAKRPIDNDACIFTISVVHDINETRYDYRLYDHGTVIYSGQFVKIISSLDIIQDIIDTQRIKWNRKVDAIAISLPGVLLHHGQVKRIDYQEIAGELASLYQLKVYVCNNTNTVALGYYASQDQYDIISYHSQPRNALVGGQGMIYKGLIIEGAHEMAGEVMRIIPDEFAEFATGYEANIFDKYGDQAIVKIKESVVHYLRASIAIIDPEVILLRSVLTPDTKELREELKKYMNEKDIPDLIYIRDISEYALLGTMLWGLEKLKKEKPK